MGVPRAKLLILLAFVVRGQEVGGSNPLAPTNHFNHIHKKSWLRKSLCDVDCDVTPRISSIELSNFGLCLDDWNVHQPTFQLAKTSRFAAIRTWE